MCNQKKVIKIEFFIKLNNLKELKHFSLKRPFVHNVKYNVSMNTWNCDDSLIVTSQSNDFECSIKVWHSNAVSSLLFEFNVALNIKLIFLNF